MHTHDSVCRLGQKELIAIASAITKCQQLSIYIYVYKCIHIYIYINMYICIYGYTYMCIHVYMDTDTHTWLCMSPVREGAHRNCQCDHKTLATFHQTLPAPSTLLLSLYTISKVSWRVILNNKFTSELTFENLSQSVVVDHKTLANFHQTLPAPSTLLLSMYTISKVSCIVILNNKFTSELTFENLSQSVVWSQKVSNFLSKTSRAESFFYISVECIIYIYIYIYIYI